MHGLAPALALPWPCLALAVGCGRGRGGRGGGRGASASCFRDPRPPFTGSTSYPLTGPHPPLFRLVSGPSFWSAFGHLLVQFLGRLGGPWALFWCCFGVENHVGFQVPFFVLSGWVLELILVPFWCPNSTSEALRREKADLRF